MTRPGSLITNDTSFISLTVSQDIPVSWSQQHHCATKQRDCVHGRLMTICHRNAQRVVTR